MRPIAALAAAIVTFGLVTACSVMSGLSVQQGATEPGDEDGGTSRRDGSSGASSSGNTGPCQHAREPAKPASATPGGSDTTLTFAMKGMVPKNDVVPFGLDLDGLCTCQEGDKNACKRGTEVCDDPGGLDNAGATIFKGIAEQGGFNLVEGENARIADGLAGIVVHVEGYNGLEDDDAVNVTFIRSPGIAAKPNFDAVEAWPVSDVVYASTEAYVAKKVLVARFTEVDVPFLSDTPQPAKMRGSVMMGTLGAGNVLSELILAGRANTAELVNSVGQLKHPLFNIALCDTVEATALFTNFGSIACGGSDMPTDPSKDGDQNTTCDALSFGVKMLMIPAEIGPNQALKTVSDRCTERTPITCP